LVQIESIDPVVPAKAGTQDQRTSPILDPRFRGGDDLGASV
jgi:hypothetical protein